MFKMSVQRELELIKKRIGADKILHKEFAAELNDLNSLSDARLKGGSITQKKILAIRRLAEEQLDLQNMNLSRVYRELYPNFKALVGLIRAEMMVVERGLQIESHEERIIKNALIVTNKDINLTKQIIEEEYAKIKQDKKILEKFFGRYVNILKSQGYPQDKLKKYIRAFATGNENILKHFHEQALPAMLKQDLLLLEEKARDEKFIQFKSGIIKKLEQSIKEINKQQQDKINKIIKIIEKYGRGEGILLNPDRNEIIKGISELIQWSGGRVTGGLIKKEEIILEHLNRELFLSKEKQKELMSEEEREETVIIHINQLLNRSASKLAALRAEALWQYFREKQVEEILGEPPIGGKLNETMGNAEMNRLMSELANDLKK